MFIIIYFISTNNKVAKLIKYLKYLKNTYFFQSTSSPNAYGITLTSSITSMGGILIIVSHTICERWEEGEKQGWQGIEKERIISRQDTYSPAFASLVFDGSRWWHDYDVVVCTFQSVLVEMVCTLSIMRVAASYGQSHVTSGLAGATTQYTSGDTISKGKAFPFFNFLTNIILQHLEDL